MSPSSMPHPQSAMKGIVYVLMAVFLFALTDVATKYLATRFNVPMVVALRYFVNIALLLVLFAPRQGRAIFRTQRTGLVVVRALALSLGSLSVGIAFTRMPVGETIAIIYLAPFAVTLLAVPLLGEKVGPVEVLAAAAGLLGVFLIVRPGGGLDTIGVILALIGAAFTVVYHLFSRILARTETTTAMLIYTAGIGAGFFGAMLPWNWHPEALTLLDLAMLFSLGVLGTLGHMLFTAAYREAPASLLGPVNYVHLVWAGLLSWLVFDHVPDFWASIGMAMIMLAGISAALKAHFMPPP